MNAQHSDSLMPATVAGPHHRGAVLAVQLLATVIVVAALAIGGSACTSTKTEVGARGAARLYQLKEWNGVYYSIELPTILLDRVGTYTLRVSDLEASVGASLYLEVSGNRSGQKESRPSSGMAGSKHPVVRIRLQNRSGDVDLTQTVGAGEVPWSVTELYQSLHAEVRLVNKKLKSFYEPGRDFTIRVEVLRPSEIPGQYLKISTCWNA